MIKKFQYDLKVLLTYTVSILLILFAYIFPNLDVSKQMKCIGFFALSGSFTNWIAIKMLFKKIPFLYGSGIILVQFEELKKGIKELILKEFFNENQINIFVLNLKEDNKIIFEDIKNNINYDKIYATLSDYINKSKFSFIIDMMGGAQVLNQLKKPILIKIKKILDQYKQLKSNPTKPPNNPPHTINQPKCFIIIFSIIVFIIKGVNSLIL